MRENSTGVGAGLELPSVLTECLLDVVDVDLEDLDDVAEVDLDPGGRSGGGVDTTAPVSSNSTLPTRAAQRDSRMASAKSGSNLSSSTDKPVDISDQGLFGFLFTAPETDLPREGCLPFAFAEIGVG